MSFKSVFTRKLSLDDVETYIDLGPEAIDDYRRRIKEWADQFGIPIEGFDAKSTQRDSGCVIHTAEGTDTVTPKGAFDQKSDRTVDDVVLDDSKE